jgi:Flp pilus assembly pilin Flp
MKEVLIYGALVAAVLGVSSTLITNMQSKFQTSSEAINTNINTAVDELVTASGGSN